MGNNVIILFLTGDNRLLLISCRFKPILKIRKRKNIIKCGQLYALLIYLYKLILITIHYYLCIAIHR